MKTKIQVEIETLRKIMELFELLDFQQQLRAFMFLKFYFLDDEKALEKFFNLLKED